MIISVTGHRPHRLGGYNSLVYDNLFKLAYSKLKSLCPEKVYTGMALGWDIAVARASLSLNIPYIAVIPFVGQEKTWKKEDQFTYHHYLKQAQNVVECSAGYDRYAYHNRNVYLVDSCDLLVALYDGETTGGTYDAISYAEKTNKPIVNLWDEYQKMMV